MRAAVSAHVYWCVAAASQAWPSRMNPARAQRLKCCVVSADCPEGNEANLQVGWHPRRNSARRLPRAP